MKSLLMKIIGWNEHRAISMLEKNGYSYMWHEERFIDGLLVGKVLCKSTCKVLTMKSKWDESEGHNMVVSID